MKKIYLFKLFILFTVMVRSNHSEISLLPYSNEKNINKTFSVTSGTSIEVINKYGDINVVTWKKDSVKFEIKITAEANKLSQVHDLMEMVDVKFTANNSMVLANLLWGTHVNAFKKGSVEVTLAAGNSQRLHIDYTIYMPENNTLKIENRFGNIFLPKLNGKVYISAIHGNLKAEKIVNGKNISVRYGELSINQIEKGEIETMFTDIFIEEAGEINIHSSSGGVEIENVNDLEIESTNQKIRIEKAKNIYAELTMSDLRIRELENKIQVESKFGDVHINEIKSGFSKVTLNVSNSSINCGFSKSDNFKYDIQAEKLKSIQLDEGFNNETDNNTNSSYQIITGKKGIGGELKVDITTKSGSIRLENVEK